MVRATWSLLFREPFLIRSLDKPVSGHHPGNDPASHPPHS